MQTEPEIRELPIEVDGDDAADALGQDGEHGVRQVEVLAGRVAPAALGASGAEVGGRHGDGLATPVAPLGAPKIAGDMVARSTRSAAVEQGRAQGGRLETVSCVV